MNQSGKRSPAFKLPSGKPVPALGQGTWLMGEKSSGQHTEIAALQRGIDLGLTLIDTAEMYGNGASEELVGKAIEGRREEVYIVSKVLPSNATTSGVIEACHRSLKRLNTDYLNLYLLHWRGGVPLADTLKGFMQLKNKGDILDFGVSNFDTGDMKEVVSLTEGDEIVTNQVFYNLAHRGIEYDLARWCSERAISIMAYSPLEHSAQARRQMLEHPDLKAVAAEHHATPAQVALAWLLHQQVIVIPKAGTIRHVEENYGAIDMRLTKTDLKKLDHAFPPPGKKIPLEMR
jgi:diketogulonate reductase-like aldo/keto reductase